MMPEKQQDGRHKTKTSWVKGRSGNPNGRPKKVISLTSEMKAQLTEVCPYDSQGRTWLKYLVDRWLAQSAKQAIYFKELIERLEGKTVQPVGGEDGGPVIVKVIYDDSDKRSNS